MAFEPSRYGKTIADILAFDGDGARLLPLACGGCCSPEAHAALSRHTARELFPRAFAPEAAMSGLWLYFSCFEECHRICQDLPGEEGSYWHAILHRQEPDAGNSAYWFRRVGRHSIFPALAEAARQVASERPEAGFHPEAEWNPFSFIDYCEQARQQPDSPAYEAARRIQRSEWQLLFDHCARPRA